MTKKDQALTLLRKGVLPTIIAQKLGTAPAYIYQIRAKELGYIEDTPESARRRSFLRKQQALIGKHV